MKNITDLVKRFVQGQRQDEQGYAPPAYGGQTGTPDSQWHGRQEYGDQARPATPGCPALPPPTQPAWRGADNRDNGATQPAVSTQQLQGGRLNQSTPARGYQSYGGPQGYPPQGYPPQGYPPQGYPPQGYPPQGYPPQGYPPQGQGGGLMGGMGGGLVTGVAGGLAGSMIGNALFDQHGTEAAPSHEPQGQADAGVVSEAGAPAAVSPAPTYESAMVGYDQPAWDNGDGWDSASDWGGDGGDGGDWGGDGKW